MPITLNDNWRVTDDGSLQWIIQRRAGNKVRVSKAGSTCEPWDARFFFDRRAHLISCIGEHCGKVSASALAAVGELPARYDEELGNERESESGSQN